MKNPLLVIALLMLTSIASGCASRGSRGLATMDLDREPMRGIWVTRWDYRSPGDVRQVMEDAAALGMTDVFWQVRGQADAFYRSGLEPWAEELAVSASGVVRTPRFDPLELACREAHARGLRLHAWFNVMPLWKDVTPPRNPAHAFHVHPEWRLFDAKGNPQPLNDHYVTVNPLRSDAEAHIVAVARDIVRRYEIDGLHLDYVRFLSETAGETQYPADALSHAAFRKATGLGAREHPKAYRMFIRERITNLVRTMGKAVKKANRDLVFSAAVWRDPLVGKSTYLQDYAAWLNEGLLDLALPMLYTDDMQLFDRELQGVLAVRAGRWMAIGIGVYKHERPEGLQAQLQDVQHTRADGFCLFGYESLFASANRDQDKSLDGEKLRKMRRDVVRAFIESTRTQAGMR